MRKIALLSCLLFLVAGIYQGATRERIKSAGPGCFYEAHADYMAGSGFFRGMRTGPTFAQMLRELNVVIASRIGTNSVYFGPRMQWAYAGYNRASPKGQPPIWEPGSSIAAEHEAAAFRRLLDSNPRFMVFWKQDFTYFSEAEMEMLDQLYDYDDSPQWLTILTRTPDMNQPLSYDW